MKNRVPIQPILLTIVLAVIAVIILVTTQLRLFQSAPLEDSGEITTLLQERFPDSTIHEDILDPEIIVLVHNGESEQCKRAMRFVQGITKKSPTYTMAVYVLQGQDYLQPLENLPEDSCWVDYELTEHWLVYPTIFFRDTVYVGYGPATRYDIKKQIRQGF